MWYRYRTRRPDSRIRLTPCVLSAIDECLRLLEVDQGQVLALDRVPPQGRSVHIRSEVTCGIGRLRVSAHRVAHRGNDRVRRMNARLRRLFENLLGLLPPVIFSPRHFEEGVPPLLGELSDVQKHQDLQKERALSRADSRDKESVVPPVEKHGLLVAGQNAKLDLCGAHLIPDL